MIAPSKYVNTKNSLLGQSTALLAVRQDGTTVSELWDKVREAGTDISYERFILCLDFLYAVGLVEIQGGTLSWHR
ncbi:ABC-three component system middle component 6 [Streptomyces chartreusis]|uniref:ABC-three component system middle component 6 n=1 Tax=Streptomyces chartreusis TaxID=1969 RepID=UPI0037A570C2